MFFIFIRILLLNIPAAEFTYIYYTNLPQRCFSSIIYFTDEFSQFAVYSKMAPQCVSNRALCWFYSRRICRFLGKQFYIPPPPRRTIGHTDVGGVFNYIFPAYSCVILEPIHPVPVPYRPLREFYR